MTYKDRTNIVLPKEMIYRMNDVRKAKRMTWYAFFQMSMMLAEKVPPLEIPEKLLRLEKEKKNILDFDFLSKKDKSDTEIVKLFS